MSAYMVDEITLVYPSKMRRNVLDNEMAPNPNLSLSICFSSAF
ncbi:MAG: hypothetical protein ABJB76_03335 [Candidatus Nitrosocosmicus sp.]